MKTLLALYDDLDSARRAVEALRKIGLRREEIGLLAHDPATDEDIEVDVEQAQQDADAAPVGRILVTVISPDTTAPSAVRVLSSFGALGVEEDAGDWQMRRVRGSREPWPVHSPNDPDPAATEEARAGRNREGIPDTDLGGTRDEDLEQEALDGGALTHGVNAEAASQPNPPGEREGDRDWVAEHEQDPASFERFEPFQAGFRRHYDDTYLGSELTFDDLLPAYRYGYDLASSDRFRGQDWDQVEPEARHAWEETNPLSPWERYRDAVAAGWEAVAAR